MIVFYGPFQPSLEEAFTSRVQGLLDNKKNQPICVVAPSRKLADRLERLLALEKGLPLFNVHFHTFHSLANAIVEEEGGILGDFISDPVFHNRLADSLIGSAFGNSPLVNPRHRPRALAESLRASLRDLSDAGVIGKDIAEHFEAEALPAGAEKSLKYLLELSDIYARKISQLKVISLSDIVREAAKKAENSAFLGRFSEIIYYGFYDLTGLQLDFFERVTSSHSSVLFFPYRKSHPAFRFADDFFNQKLGGCDLRELEADTQSRALGPALDRLFSPTSEPSTFPLAQNLRFVSASGVRDEVWFAAKEMLRLVEEEGFLIGEIGLVARSLDSYRDDIARILKENGIPFDMDATRPLLRHPLAKTVLNLLNIMRRDFPSSTVEDIVSSPYFMAAAGYERDWKINIRRVIALLGIGGGWIQWRGRLREALEKDKDVEKDWPRDDAQGLWDILNRWRENLEAAPDSWDSFVRRALVIVKESIALPKNPSPDEIEVLNRVMAEIQSLSSLNRIGPPRDWADGMDVLEEKLKSASLDMSSGVKGVRVLSAMDARGESFRALFLLGLNEGFFPRQISEDPLLKDSSRSFLRHPAGYWIRPKKEGYEEEKLLFYLLAASVKERIYCVYSRSNEEGETQIPSFYLYELAKAAGITMTQNSARVSRGPAEKLEMCPSQNLTAEEMSLRAVFEGEDARPYLKALHHPQLETLSLGLKAAWDINAAGEAGPRDGLAKVPVKILKRWEERISSTGVDLYVTCPFRFFAERILGFKERNRANTKEEIHSNTIGIIYHDILRRFYSSIPPRVWEENPPSYQKFLDQAIEDSFALYDQRSLGIYPLLWVSKKNRMTRLLRRFVERDVSALKASGFRPMEFETEIEGSFPKDDHRRLFGVLDRVDMSADKKRLTLVDYKKKWKQDLQFKDADGIENLVSKGKTFQLPFYLELLSQKNSADAIDGACLYGIEESEDVSGFPVDHPYAFGAWMRQREDFFKRTEALLDSIAAGVFPINPEEGKHGHCAHCDFQRLCRKNHAPSRRRAAAILSTLNLSAFDDPR